ncbi:MAG TPA: SMP-30/gluconolactonase/LRE family protein [Acidobacteriaceae bacterium]
MKRREFLKSAAAVGVTAAWVNPSASAATPQNQPEPPLKDYPLGPDSKRQPDVPSGKVFSFTLNKRGDQSKFFPGTQRTVDVYVPAQYTADRPACVLVALDNLMRTQPIVFDNLIHRKELPVIIAIGLSSGTDPSADPPQNPRFNRSFEFDSLSDVLAEFILQELLPAVEQHKTPDGLPIHLSTDPNDRGMMGGSTGGIGSFTVAWQRPDAFRRVSSMVGTYVGMRGGDRYPVLVRKTDPKPIRIFLQDGSRDGWPGGLEFGDWWMGNQEMERALTFSGYEVNHSWGVLGHEGSHGESILPDVMRWLWKEWPKPVEAGTSQNSMLRTVLQPSEAWKQAWSNSAASGQTANSAIYRSPSVLNEHSTAAALARDSSGRVYGHSPSTGTISRIAADGSTEHFATVSAGNNGMVFGPDGRLYVAETTKSRIVALDGHGHTAVIAEGIHAVGITVTHAGNIYVTESNDASAYSGKVWLIRPQGEKTVVAEGLNGPSGISLSPDGLWLCAAESKGHHGYSYRVQPNGELQWGEPYYWFHVPDTANDSGVTQVCMDRDGYAYAATRMGVQIFDRNGRVRAILPITGHQLAGICFGDADMQTLYVSTGDAIYRRKLKSVGFAPAAAPIVLPEASAG